ncbi:MAG: hypothetical protein JNL39_09090 [Opitutaceae bacterium]|nr:hypothetical protein [Opitutaceae bacterium]
MKKLARFLLGVLSGLLLSIGFANAADRLDPLSSDLSQRRADVELKGGLSCDPCDVAE